MMSRLHIATGCTSVNWFAHWISASTSDYLNLYVPNMINMPFQPRKSRRRLASRRHGPSARGQKSSPAARLLLDKDQSCAKALGPCTEIQARRQRLGTVGHGSENVALNPSSHSERASLHDDPAISLQYYHQTSHDNNSQSQPSFHELASTPLLSWSNSGEQLEDRAGWVDCQKSVLSGFVNPDRSISPSVFFIPPQPTNISALQDTWEQVRALKSKMSSKAEDTVRLQFVA